MDDLTAILLCGGKGERLKPFTDKLPKPLVPLNGRPLLWHLVQFLKANGVKRFVFCTGYKAEKIDEFIAQELDDSFEVHTVNNGDASIMERIVSARAHVPGRALVCYGDTVANVSVPELTKHHEKSGGGATVTVYPLQSPFGVVNFDDSTCIKAFEEKPMLPYWINIGFFLFESEVLASATTEIDYPEFLSRLAAENKLFAYRHSGKHLTVNTEKERKTAESEIIEMFTLQ